jgi:hypothetical protein
MSSQYIKKCITICIQGHGSIITENGAVDFIKNSSRNNARILTIPGGIGRKGLMKAECPTMTMRGSKKKGVSDVLLCGQALDVMSMEYFHSVYHDLSKKQTLSGCEISRHGVEIISENIPLIYANANIPYFHKHMLERDITSYPSEGYKLTKPHYNKLYTIYPTTHEYCNQSTSDCRGGKCKLLTERLRSCPEYGITILHSSDPSDTEYTISGLPMVNDIKIEKENRLSINLNQKEGHEPLNVRDDDHEEIESGNQIPTKKSSYIFWKMKLLHYKLQEIMVIQNHITYQKKMREIYNNDMEISEEKKQQLLLQQDEKIKKLKDTMTILDRRWRDRLFTYDMMTNAIDRFTPRSMLSDKQEDLLPEVTLEDLIDIFVNGMKYDYVYIIDPTCNSYKFQGNRQSKLLKMVAHNYVERIRTKTDRPSFLPIAYVKRYNNPSEGTNIPLRNRVNVRRTKSIGGTKKRITKRKRKITRKQY